MAQGPGANSTLNGVIVEYDGSAKLRVGLQPFEHSDQLHQLRQENRESHFFRREDNSIASVALRAGADPLGDEVVERPLSAAAALVAPLALDALMRYFHQHGRRIWRHKPLRMLSSKGADQLLRQAVPIGVSVPTWLEQAVSYVFDTRTVYPDRADPAVLLACDVKTSTIIAATCEELLEAGVPLEGRYVQVPTTDGDTRLSPKPHLVGRVVSVDGHTLVLSDHEEGYETVSADNAFLEPRYESFSWCLGHIVPEHAATILARLDGLSGQVNGGPERLRRIRSMFDHLRNQDLELAPGLKFTLGRLLKNTGSTPWFPRTEVIKKPPLIFSPLPGRTDIWNERGIDKHGPYDQRSFTPRRPQIAIICQAEAQGQVEQFVRKFLDGMPEVVVGRAPSTRKPYEQGFIRRFVLEGVDTRVFTTSRASAAGYREACHKAISHAADNGFEWTLALVQIDDAFHLLQGNDNPYLVTKAVLMKHHIPVQEVTIEKMMSPPSDLVYIVNDISLASYAKMGGTPWLLSSEAPVAHELVVGLGSHHVGGSRIGAKERVVGITTVFSGDGRYLLESRSKAVPYADYPAVILETLKGAISEVRRDQNWEQADSVRLVFHAFKPFRDAEVDAVKELMTDLSLTHAEFAVLHVVDVHPFLAFDEKNAGAYAPGNTRKGVFAPERGTALKFTRDEILIVFTGSREVKQPSDGLPKPILLRLHRESTFKDITYLARQAFAFSCHSWRGFAPAPLPITILYSELIAKMLKNLDGVSDWDPDALLGRIGRTRWFL